MAGDKTRPSVFITGTSSGIGHALSHYYLSEGWIVYGLSRRCSEDLESYEHFHHQSIDLREVAGFAERFLDILPHGQTLDLVVLNAGVLGHFGDVRETTLENMQETMMVNVWSNKVIFDELRRREVALRQVVAISSGASVNGNRGWSGYSISKAALNMFVKLLAAENPRVHFSSLAPGLVDTEIQETLCKLPIDERFPALEVLRSKRHTPEMPSAEEAAILLAKVIRELPDQCASGDYIDIRKLATRTSNPRATR